MTLIPPDLFTVLTLQAAISLVTFTIYGLDKRAAKRGGRRLRERTLHLLAAAGGWLGALLGQKVFRHKTIKQPFRRVFWLTLLPPLGMLGWAVSGLL